MSALGLALAACDRYLTNVHRTATAQAEAGLCWLFLAVVPISRLTRVDAEDKAVCTRCGHPRWKHAGTTEADGSSACHHKDWDRGGGRGRCRCIRFVEERRDK